MFRSFHRPLRHAFRRRLVPLAAGLLLAFVSLSPSARAASLSLSQDGVAIDAGSLGTFTLTDPQLIDDSQNVLHKLVEKSISGQKATLAYEGGGHIEFAIKEGVVGMRFSNMPPDTRKYMMDMLIDPSFAKGGTWRVGDKAGVFPREKPSNPHLFQGNADTFRLADATGQALLLKIPEFAYQELNDNREWNWNIYEWLPSADGEFRTAFRDRPDEGFSFHLANTIRKFGKPYTAEDYSRRMIGRVRRWGFNSVGAFSSVPDAVLKAENFPYVAHLPLSEWEGLPRVPGVFESFDPFDPATRSRIEKNIAEKVPARKDDPLLIGWFIVNEPRFDEIPKAVPALDGTHACKRQLVDTLRGKYNGESANSGLISVADRPWKDCVEEMRKTNATIYDVLLGKRPAFAWEDPRFRGE